MSPRLLPVLCLLFLSQASFTQESGTAKPPRVAETCPVTKASDKSFVPHLLRLCRLILRCQAPHSECESLFRPPL